MSANWKLSSKSCAAEREQQSSLQTKKYMKGQNEHRLSCKCKAMVLFSCTSLINIEIRSKEHRNYVLMSPNLNILYLPRNGRKSYIMGLPHLSEYFPYNSGNLININYSKRKMKLCFGVTTFKRVSPQKELYDGLTTFE